MKRIIYLTILYVFVFCSASMAKTTTVTHPEKEICKGESVTLTPDASGDTYLWTPGSETTKTVVKTPVADTEYVCKVTKKGGSTDTGNLITLGDFEFPPSQVDNNKSAQNRLGDWISYEYLNFDRGGKDIAQGATTTATNANNVKTAYFSKLAPHKGNYMLVCDGSNNSDARIWSARNLKLKKGETYQFSCWAANIDLEYAKHGKASLPKLKFVIENEIATGTLLEFTAPEALGVWQEYTATYTPTKDLGWCHIYIVNYNTVFEGNDFAIDDVYFGTVTQEDDDIINEVFPIKVKECSTDRTIHACYGSPVSITAVTDGVSYLWNYKGDDDSHLTRTWKWHAADAVDLVCEVTKQGGAKVLENVHLIADVHLGKDLPKDYQLCAGDGPYVMEVTIAPMPNNFSQYPDKYYFNPTFLLDKNGTPMPGEVMFNYPIASYDGLYVSEKIGTTDVYVMHTDNGECKSTSTFNISAICCPDTVAFEHIVCQSDTKYMLSTETEGTLYKWHTGENTREIGVDVSKTGTKTYACNITITTPNGVCSRTELHTVTVVSKLTKSVDDKVCEGEPYNKYGFSITAEETIGQTVIERQHKDVSVVTKCDSITTLTLVVCPTENVTIEDRVLLGESYNKNGFTVSKEETQNVGIITKTNKGKTKVCECDSVTTLKLTVYEVKDIKPMAYFSPNDDGLNDLWLIENIETHPDAYVQIYDRFDKLLLNVKASEFKGWDGKYNGHDMPMTDYWYVIISEDMDKKISGHFTLKR